MNDVLQFLKDFGSLLNMALILALAGIAFQIFRATVEKKNAELDAARAFSVEKVAEKFRALKEYYETHLVASHEASLKSLEEERRKAIEQKEHEFQARIDAEIQKRRALLSAITPRTQQADASVVELKISISEACGTFSVTGHNPHTPEHTYYGRLRIEAKGEVLSAQWQIGPRGTLHIGVGLLVGNTLSFSFASPDFVGGVNHGIVVYEFISKDVMRGTWTGYGESRIGFEEGLRVDEDGQSQTQGHSPT